jgi:hypothetical protein
MDRAKKNPGTIENSRAFMTFDSDLPCGLLLDICKNCSKILSVQAVICIPSCTVCENCIVVVTISPG